jgi:exodeoxyribonuclease-3
MKIATFNINNINRRLPNLLRWLQQAKPDVVALQELKSTMLIRFVDKRLGAA